MRLRHLALTLAIPLAAPANAQLFSPLIERGIRFARDSQALPQQDQGNPTQPTGGPLPPAKRSGDLPKPGPLGPEGGGFKLIHSGGILNATGRFLHLTGGVEFTDRGYHVWADEAYGDRGTDTYTLKGNVIVVGQDESIYGDTVQVDFQRRTFVAESAETTLKPALVKGRLKGNLYMKALKAYGSEREIFGESTSSTTCSYPEPHFEIIAEKTDVRPGRRVIFRKVKLRLLGHTILRLPFLSIPLDQRTYNNLPEVGKGQLEGYFIKNRYGVPLAGNSAINTRLDYYSKLGTGYGGDWTYENRNLRGIFRAFTITGPHNQLELISQHRENFGKLAVTLDSAFEKDNYLISSNGMLINLRALALLPQGLSSTRLSLFRTSSTTGGANSLQQTINLNDNRFFSKRLSYTLDLANSRSAASFGPGQDVHRQQLDVNFRAAGDLDKAQARLDYIRSIPIGESSNFFTTSDITPSLSLLSDARRLFGAGFEKSLPFQTELSWGEYGDPVTKGRITRSNFDFRFQNPLRSAKRFSINYQGDFRQGVYSDNTAQYTLQYGTQISYRFTRDTAFNIRYNYLRPYGFTPLQIDRRGRTNNITSDLAFHPFRNATLGAQTGYDFNVARQMSSFKISPWQQVGLRGEYGLGRWFNFRALSTYDTTRHAYSSTRLDLTYIPGATYLSIGAKYDGIRKQWAAANLFLDGLAIGRLRASVLLNYNGYLKRFEAEHFSFIYDLHCGEAILQILNTPTGFRSGRTIVFFFRLKALPFDTPFGTGQRGQPIGTGTGRDY